VASASKPFAQVKITYTNPAATTRIVELYVNDETVTRIAFPPTKRGSASVWIEAKLDRSGTTNVLNFATSEAAGVQIEAIDVH
jgi:hypothetical protein